MSDTPPSPFQPLLFFLSKIFILVGMVLVFTFLFMGVGMFFSKYFFGIDAFSNPSIFNEYEQNPAVINALKFIQVLNTIGGFLLPAILFPKALQQIPSTFVRWQVKPRVLDVLIALGVVILSIPLIAWLIQLNEGYRFPPGLESLEMKMKAMQESASALTKAFVRADGISGLLTNLVIVAMLPAICEEFFFRGALMRFLMMCLRNKHLAIIFTGILFSMMHGEFYGLLPRFVLGVFLGYIAFYSGSIWPAVGAHFLNNALALLSAHFHWGESGIAILDDHYVFEWYWILGSTLILAGMFYLLFTNRKREQID